MRFQLLSALSTVRGSFVDDLEEFWLCILAGKDFSFKRVK